MTPPRGLRDDMRPAVILAGGRSRRFGSHKALAPLDGRPMIAAVVDRLVVAGFAPIIAGPASLFAAFGHPVIEDADPFGGPLVALAHLWRRLPYERLLLVPCDMPRLAPDLLTAMWEMSAPYDLVATRGPKGPSPMPAVYTRATAEVAHAALRAGRRDLRVLMDGPLSCKLFGPAEMAKHDPTGASLTNVNYAHDLPRGSTLHSTPVCAQFGIPNNVVSNGELTPKRGCGS